MAMNVYLVFRVNCDDDFITKIEEDLIFDDEALESFIESFFRSLKTNFDKKKGVIFFHDEENINSFLTLFENFKEEKTYLQSISKRLRTILKNSKPCSVVEEINANFFIWDTQNNYARQIISHNHIFVKIVENILKNQQEYPFILNLDALKKGELGLRENNLFIFKDSGKVEIPQFVMIPCLENIGEIRK